MAAFVDLDGRRVHYELSGTGSPLVFIHAGIADLRMWDPQFDRYARHCRVLRYDVRSFGQSTNPAGTYYAHTELLDLLDHFGIESAVLVGASNGGRIAINCALEAPDRVAGLVLIGAGVEGDTVPPEVMTQWQAIGDAYQQGDIPQSVELTLRMWIDGPHRTPAQVDPAVRDRVATMLTHLYYLPDEPDQGKEQPLDPPAITRLHTLRMPTLVIQGDQDVVHHRDLSEQIAQSIPGATLAQMVGASHLPSLEQPHEFNDLLDNFLSRVGWV